MRVICRVRYKGFNDEPVKKLVKDYLNKKHPEILKKGKLMTGGSGFDLQRQIRDIDLEAKFDPKKTQVKPTKFTKGIYAVEVLTEQ